MDFKTLEQDFSGFLHTRYDSIFKEHISTKEDYLAAKEKASKLYDELASTLDKEQKDILELYQEAEGEADSIRQNYEHELFFKEGIKFLLEMMK